jgi:hypothetical protein
MKYEVCIAADVSAYDTNDVVAESDEEAIEKAAALFDAPGTCLNVEWCTGQVNQRIVHVIDSKGRTVCEGMPVPLDAVERAANHAAELLRLVEALVGTAELSRDDLEDETWDVLTRAGELLSLLKPEEYTSSAPENSISVNGEPE